MKIFKKCVDKSKGRIYNSIINKRENKYILQYPDIVEGKRCTELKYERKEGMDRQNTKVTPQETCKVH